MMSIDPSDISKMMLEASKSGNSSSMKNGVKPGGAGLSTTVSSADLPSVVTSDSKPFERSGVLSSSDDPRLDAGWMQKQMADIEAMDKEDPLPDPPRRPLSAYNFFFKAERARILGVDDEEDAGDEPGEGDDAASKKRKHRKTPGMIGFRQLANHVGERWRSLSEEEKAPYQEKFEQDRIRYKDEMKAWEDAQRRRTIRQNKAMMARIKLEKEAKKKHQEEQKEVLLKKQAVPNYEEELDPVLSLDPTSSSLSNTRTKTSAILNRAMSIIGEDKERLRNLEQRNSLSKTPGFVPCLQDTFYESNSFSKQDFMMKSKTEERPVVSPQAAETNDWFAVLKTKKQKMMDHNKLCGPNTWGMGKDVHPDQTLERIRRGVQLKQWQQHLHQQLAQCDYESHQAQMSMPPPSMDRRMGGVHPFMVDPKEQQQGGGGGGFTERDFPEPQAMSSEEAMLHYKFNMWQKDGPNGDGMKCAPVRSANGHPMMPSFNDEMSPTFNHLEVELGNIMGDDIIECLATM